MVDPDKMRRNSVYRRQLLKKRTVAEIRMAQILRNMGIRFFEQKGFVAGDFHCIVDFYIPSPHKLCIEVDGGYHNTKAQKYRDQGKDSYLRSRKVRVVRFTNEDVMFNEATIREKILTHLKK